MTDDLQDNVVLFDGMCNLCSGAVQFIIKRDPGGKFKFASLQSKTGVKYSEKFNIDTNKGDSIVLVQGNRHHVKSSAALRIAIGLKGAYPILYAFIIIPAFLRDAIYDFIAKNRYKWFGKKETCWLPTPELKARFIDE